MSAKVPTKNPKEPKTGQSIQLIVGTFVHPVQLSSQLNPADPKAFKNRNNMTPKTSKIQQQRTDTNRNHLKEGEGDTHTKGKKKKLDVNHIPFFTISEEDIAAKWRKLLSP